MHRTTHIPAPVLDRSEEAADEAVELETAEPEAAELDTAEPDTADDPALERDAADPLGGTADFVRTLEPDRGLLDRLLPARPERRSFES